MLKIGERLGIGEHVYEVINFNRTEDLSPCVMCDLFDNDCTEAMSESCLEVIPLNAYLKKVEQPPQVDCK